MRNSGQITNRVRIIISDDHFGIRFGLRSFIEKFHQDQIEIIGEAESGIETYKLCKSLKPNVLVMDVKYQNGGPQGDEVILKLRNERFPVSIIALTGDAFTLTNIASILKAGADRCLDKTTSFSEVVSEILSLGQDLRSSQDKSGITQLKKSSTGDSAAVLGKLVKLTSRELQLLLQLIEAKSNNEIAADLSISPRTVSNHFFSIYHKLDLSNRTDAGIFASENRILIEDKIRNLQMQTR